MASRAVRGQAGGRAPTHSVRTSQMVCAVHHRRFVCRRRSVGLVLRVRRVELAALPGLRARAPSLQQCWQGQAVLSPCVRTALISMSRRPPPGGASTFVFGTYEGDKEPERNGNVRAHSPAISTHTMTHRACLCRKARAQGAQLGAASVLGVAVDRASRRLRAHCKRCPASSAPTRLGPCAAHVRRAEARTACRCSVRAGARPASRPASRPPLADSRRRCRSRCVASHRSCLSISQLGRLWRAAASAGYVRQWCDVASAPH